MANGTTLNLGSGGNLIYDEDCTSYHMPACKLHTGDSVGTDGGPVGPNNPIVIGGTFNTAAPTLTNASKGTLQLDVSGNLKVVGNVPAAGADSGASVKAGAVFNSALPTYTTGQRTDLQADAGGRLLVQSTGNVASGSADSGNAVKVGGVFNTALPTLTNGQRGDVQLDSSSRLLAIVNGNVASGATDAGAPVKVGGVFNTAQPTLTNGQRGDLQLDANGNLRVLPPAPSGVTIFASASQTTTQTQADQTNTGQYRGIIVILNMTVVGTGSVTVEIDGKDPASGVYFPLLTGLAVTTNGTTTYTVYPSAPNTANVSQGTPLPSVYRVKVTANNANAATYSVGAVLLP